MGFDRGVRPPDLLALFSAGTWPYGPHAPNTSELGGFIPLTVRHLAPIAGGARVLSLGTGNAQS
jgi:hypothetical protein